MVATTGNHRPPSCNSKSTPIVKCVYNMGRSYHPKHPKIILDIEGSSSHWISEENTFSIFQPYSILFQPYHQYQHGHGFDSKKRFWDLLFWNHIPIVVINPQIFWNHLFLWKPFNCLLFFFGFPLFFSRFVAPHGPIVQTHRQRQEEGQTPQQLLAGLRPLVPTVSTSDEKTGRLSNKIKTRGKSKGFSAHVPCHFFLCVQKLPFFPVSFSMCF